MKSRIRCGTHELYPSATILVNDGRDEIAPIGPYATCEQHEFVTSRLCANLEPFLGVFR